MPSWMSTPIAAKSPSRSEPSAPSFSQRWKDLVCTFSTLLEYSQGSWVPSMKDLKALRTCIYESHGTMTTKQFLIGTQALSVKTPQGSEQREQAIMPSPGVLPKEVGVGLQGNKGSTSSAYVLCSAMDWALGSCNTYALLFVLQSPALTCILEQLLLESWFLIAFSLGVGCDQTEPGRVRNTICFCLPPTLKPN